MGMPAQETKWTAEMARALPDDGKRYEVLDGELAVTPAPSFRHQYVAQYLWSILDRYVREHGIGYAIMAPAEIEFSARRSLQPDVFVVPGDGGRPERWTDVPSLLLAVEVLSPSTAYHDRVTKRGIYLRERVPDYWIVDPGAHVVDRWRPGDERPEVIAERLLWQPREGVEPLAIDVPAFFAEVLD
jgi:Uma2 family endonuclease